MLDHKDPEKEFDANDKDLQNQRTPLKNEATTATRQPKEIGRETPYVSAVRALMFEGNVDDSWFDAKDR